MILTEKTSEIKHTQLTPDGDSFKMRVPVLQADQPNLNRRTYPLTVVKAAVEDLRAKLKKRTAFGSTKHEKDLEVDQVSHYIEDIELDEKGTATAVLRILSTQRGRNLSAIIKGGGRLGISARGFGDVDEKGTVKTGYRIAGVDFVMDPSFNFQVGKECVMFESRSEEDENNGSVTEEKLREFGLIEDGPKELTEDQVKIRWEAAQTAGYRGTLEQYSKSVLQMN
jgi:hypothetical protein